LAAGGDPDCVNGEAASNMLYVLVEFLMKIEFSERTPLLQLGEALEHVNKTGKHIGMLRTLGRKGRPSIATLDIQKGTVAGVVAYCMNNCGATKPGAVAQAHKLLRRAPALLARFKKNGFPKGFGANSIENLYEQFGSENSEKGFGREACVRT